MTLVIGFLSIPKDNYYFYNCNLNVIGTTSSFIFVLK